MENKEYTLGSHVIMKKKHPCGSNEWEIIRLGADIKIKCCGCGRMIFIPRIEFNKKIKKVLMKEV
ncbi:MAG TPA: DUF951 domain-containing protein [Candidatus Onthousia faecigallinarum]|nr:DUF951 domain-containing protein [Candidatus Onthousia faecigallinarum]